VSGPIASQAVSTPLSGKGTRRAQRTKYVFLVPTIVYFLLLGIFPLLFSLALVFSSWQPGTREIAFVGLANLERLVGDQRFWNALPLTVVYVFVAVTVELWLGFFIALALQPDIRGKHVFRLLFVLPMLLPPIAISYTWKMLFDFNRGPINYALGLLGIPPVQWLAGSQTAVLSLVIVDVWQWTPFVALAMLAALESLPTELYEAAVVDGASAWSLVRYISLPLLQPYIVAILLLRAIDAFKIFDTVFVLTGGGPGTATEVLNFYAYVAGFRPFNMGFTATVSWSIVVIMIVIFMLFLRAFERLEEV